MAEESSIKQLFQTMIPESIALCEGKVTCANPLKVQVTNNPKMVATGATLACPRHLTDYTVYMTVNHQTENTSGGSGDAAFAAHLHDYTGKKPFKVHEALQVGEKVFMLRFGNGERYYILDRKG